MDHDPNLKTSSNQFPESSEANMDSPFVGGNSWKFQRDLRPSPWLPLVIAAFLFLFLLRWFLECPCRNVGQWKLTSHSLWPRRKAENHPVFTIQSIKTIQNACWQQWKDDKNWFDCCSLLLFIPFFLVLLNSQPKSFSGSWKPLQSTWTFLRSSSSCFFDFFFFLYSSCK